MGSMIKIIFVRTAPYEYNLFGKSLYESFDLVARKLYEPTLQRKLSLPNLPKPDTIFCSPRKRSIETAKAIKQKFNPKSELRVTTLLREIDFSMSQFIAKAEFENVMLAIARTKFIQAFARNKLDEKKEAVRARIDKLLGLVRKKSGTVLCCSHGFFMKLVQIYLKDKTIFAKPKKLVKLFEPGKKPFDFLEYFVTEIDET